MILIKQSDFASLKGNKSYDGLHEHLMAVSRNGRGTIAWNNADGTMLVRVEDLGTAFRNLLAEWIRNSNIDAVQVKSAPATAAPATLEPDDELARRHKREREQIEINQKAIDKAAHDRAVYYATEEGLLDDAHNHGLITAWFEANRASFTAYNIDLAIAALTGQLNWAVWSKRRAVAPPVEQTPCEPDYIDTLSRKDIIKKLGDRETRERLIERVVTDRKKRGEKLYRNADALLEINERLAQPVEGEVGG